AAEHGVTYTFFKAVVSVAWELPQQTPEQEVVAAGAGTGTSQSESVGKPPAEKAPEAPNALLTSSHEPVRMCQWQYYVLSDSQLMDKVRICLLRNCLKKLNPEEVPTIVLSDAADLALLSWCLTSGTESRVQITRLGSTHFLPYLQRCGVSHSPLMDFSWTSLPPDSVMAEMERSTMTARVMVETTPEKTVDQVMADIDLQHERQRLFEWDYVLEAEERLQIAQAGKEKAQKTIEELKKRKHSEIESPMPDKS
ncbi:unnamed protein product, partial [Symbiodinium necroappetens]